MIIKNRLPFVALGILSLVAVPTLYFWWNTNAQKPEIGIKEGFEALDLSLERFDGESFILNEHRGEVVVLEFMTTWCPVCARQHAELKKLIKTIGGFKLVSIEIDVTLKSEAFEEWANEKGYEWFVSHSPVSGNEYKVTGVPTIIVVDKKGIIRYRDHYTSSSELQNIIEKYQ